MAKETPPKSAKQKSRTRAKPSYASVADLRRAINKGSKAQGTIKDYEGCLRRADAWLPGQLVHLQEDQNLVEVESAAECAASDTSAPFEVPKLPENAKECFRVPMECTPYLISLFLVSECMSSPEPKGDSVLKSIRAAFVWRFELV